MTTIDAGRALHVAQESGWGWLTYAKIAAAVGCSPELVAAIVKGRTR